MADAFIAQLHSRGPPTKVYGVLRGELPGLLSQADDGHQLVLDALAQLLNVQGGQASSKPLCALLLEAAHTLPSPTPAHAQHAAVLCEKHPHFVRKLVMLYKCQQPGASSSTVALTAAKALWAETQQQKHGNASHAGEVALLIAEHGLHGEFNLPQVLRAAIKANQIQAVSSLARSNTDTALLYLELLVASGKAKDAVKSLHKLSLRTSDVPHSLLRRIRLSLMASRLRWLARSMHWDLVDREYQVLSEAAAAPTRPTSPLAESVAIGDAAFAEELVVSAQLAHSDWLHLATILTQGLCASGLRSAAVHGAVRHGLEEPLRGTLRGVTADERTAALSSSEEDVATGAHHIASAPGSSATTRGGTPKAPVAGPFYALDVPLAAVEMVADGRAALAMCEHVLAKGGVLGIDSEWSDESKGSAAPVVQLIQLSTGARVYLLDVPSLTRSAEDAEALRDVMGRIMGAERLLKIGFGLSHDLRVLRKCHPAFTACSPDAVRPCIDLCDMYCAMRGLSKQTPGLSTLVAETFGLPLDKAMQMSNWTRRPLCRPQLHYAALDAHCLVRIFAMWERERLLRPASKLRSEVARAPPPLPKGDRRFLCCGAVFSPARDGRRVAVGLRFGVSFAKSLLDS